MGLELALKKRAFIKFKKEESLTIFDALLLYFSINPYMYRNRSSYYKSGANIPKWHPDELDTLLERVIETIPDLELIDDTQPFSKENLRVKVSDFKAWLLENGYPLKFFEDHPIEPSQEKSISRLMAIAKHVEKAYYNNALPHASTPKGQIMKFLEINYKEISLGQCKQIAIFLNPDAHKVAGAPKTMTKERKY